MIKNNESSESDDEYELDVARKWLNLKKEKIATLDSNSKSIKLKNLDDSP